MSKYKLYFDGGKKPNFITYGYVILKDDKIICSNGGKIFTQKHSNNYAEYIGLICGLSTCIILGIKDIEIYGDSLIVVRQINKDARCRSKFLRPCKILSYELLKYFSTWEISWISRKDNKQADRMTRYEN